MNKMTVAAALAALAVGAAAGWFAAGARGKNKCENVEVCKYGNMKTANDGSAGTTKGGRLFARRQRNFTNSW